MKFYLRQNSYILNLMMLTLVFFLYQFATFAYLINRFIYVTT